MHPADDPSLLARVFDRQRLSEAARVKAGLERVDDDPAIVEALERILDDLKRGTAQLGEMGLHAMEAYLVDSLAMRMRIRARLAAEPAIARERIVAPVIITGLPRTGTTKLQRVLAATGQFQSIPLWKILDPLKGPEPDDVARRIASAEAIATMTQQAFPHFYAGHPMLAHEPDEESLFLEVAFKADPACWRAHLPGFMAWLCGQDLEPTYRWLESVLKLLQSQDEPAGSQRRWVLKAPGHLGRLDELFTVFPDATLVHCHRDPLTSLPSGAALAREMHGFYSDRFDAHAAGRFVMDLLSHDMAKCLQQRRRWEAAGKTIVDLQFADIAERAQATCASVFRKIGLPFDDLARRGVARWDAANPAHLHGRFEYDLATYGIDTGEVRERFGAYASRHVAGA